MGWKVVIIIIITGFSSLINPVTCQTRERKWGMTIGGSAIKFDLPEALADKRIRPLDPGTYFSLSRFLNGAFDFSTNIIISHDVPYPISEELFARGAFGMMSYNLKFKFNNGIFISEDALIAPYVSLGIGGSYHERVQDVFIPFGGGIRFQLTPKWAILSHVQSRNSLNDHFQPTTYTLGITYQIPSKHSPPPAQLPMPDPLEYQILLTEIFPQDKDGDGIVDSQDLCPEEAGFPRYDGCKVPANTENDLPLLVDLQDTLQQGIAYMEEGAKVGSQPEQLDHSYSENDFLGEKIDPFSKVDPSTDIIEHFSKDDQSEMKNSHQHTDTQVYPQNNNAHELERARQELPCVNVSQQSIQELSVYFDKGSFSIRQEGLRNLSQIADIMLSCSQVKLRIAGHTDNLGAYRNNKILSVMRAFKIKYYLVKTWEISQSRIISDGYADNIPLTSNDTEIGRQQNRRVNFEIIIE